MYICTYVQLCPFWSHLITCVTFFSTSLHFISFFLILFHSLWPRKKFKSRSISLQVGPWSKSLISQRWRLPDAAENQHPSQGPLHPLWRLRSQIPRQKALQILRQNPLPIPRLNPLQMTNRRKKHPHIGRLGLLSLKIRTTSPKQLKNRKRHLQLTKNAFRNFLLLW